jgi:hypothetical protein
MAAPRSRPARSAGILLVVLTGVAIAVLTLTPRSGHSPRDCGAVLLALCGDRFGLDFVYNVVAFLPIGIGLALAGISPGRIGLIGLIASGLIEASQWAFLPSRDASLLDVLANGLGTFLGGVAARRFRSLVAPTPAAARVLAPVSAGVIAVALAVGGYLMGPSYPNAVWYSQWTADLGQYDRFDGRLLAFELDGRPVPSGPIAGGPAPVARDSGLTVRIRFEDGHGQTARLAPIASIFDQEQRKVLVVGEERGKLVFEPRIRAEDFGLQPIGVSVAGPADRPEQTAAEARWRRGQMSIQAAPVDRRADLYLTPISAWAVLLPRPIRGGAVLTTVNAALLLLLFFIPAAYAKRGAGASGPTRLVTLVAIGGAAVAALLPPGLWPGPLSEWAAVAAGVLAGVLAGRGEVPRRR